MKLFFSLFQIRSLSKTTIHGSASSSFFNYYSTEPQLEESSQIELKAGENIDSQRAGPA